MRAARWYVIQVETGRELAACEAISRVCQHEQERRALESDMDADQLPVLLQECFAPSYKTQFKLHGEWHNEERLLLPGYVVAVTDNPWELARVMWRIPHFTRIIKMGETFVPLSDDDRSWIERWTTEGDRSIPMSVAYKRGDTVVVVDGPLVGLEGTIDKIKRRQNEAEIVIRCEDGKTIRTAVGLAVLPEPEEENRKQ